MINIADDLKRQFEPRRHLFIDKRHSQYTEDTLIELFKYRIGESYDGTTITPAAKQIAEHITGEFSTGLMFFGRTGSGKTVMMEILIALINKAARKVFKLIPAEDIFKHLIGKRELGIPVEDSTFTFIDDLGDETLKHFNEFPIVSFIANKYSQNKLIFCTTNMTSEEFKSHYGERISSRVMEMFTPINFGGTDFRLK